MRSRLVLTALAAAALAACTPQTLAPTPPAEPAPVGKVQQYTRAICSFVPTAQTVNALFVRSNTVKSLSNIAQDICTSVQNNPMTEGPRGGRTVPRLNGVPIRGKFVR